MKTQGVARNNTRVLVQIPAHFPLSKSSSKSACRLKYIQPIVSRVAPLPTSFVIGQSQPSPLLLWAWKKHWNLGNKCICSEAQHFSLHCVMPRYRFLGKTLMSTWIFKSHGPWSLSWGKARSSMGGLWGVFTPSEQHCTIYVCHSLHANLPIVTCELLFLVDLPSPSLQTCPGRSDLQAKPMHHGIVSGRSCSTFWAVSGGVGAVQVGYRSEN